MPRRRGSRRDVRRSGVDGLYRLAVFVLFLGALSPRYAEQPSDLSQRCGGIITAPELSLWTLHDGVLEILDVNGESSEVSASFAIPESPNGAYQAIPLASGAGLALLDNAGLDEPSKTLTVITPEGSIFSVTSADSNFTWQRLSQETEAGDLTIIAHNSYQAYLIEVTWTESGLNLGAPQPLPFRLFRARTLMSLLSISPGGNYIGNIRFDDETRNFHYFIYSREEGRIIWETPYDGDGIVNVMWFVNEPERLALVSSTTRETHSVLTLISRNGEATPFFDFRQIFGVDVRFTTWSGFRDDVVVPSRVNSARLYEQTGSARLIGFDHEIDSFVDFCVNTESRLIPSSDGRYAVFQGGQSALDRLTGLDLMTGDIFYIPFKPVTRPLAGH